MTTAPSSRGSTDSRPWSASTAPPGSSETVNESESTARSDTSRSFDPHDGRSPVCARRTVC
jgi:hypothetical protein